MKLSGIVLNKETSELLTVLGGLWCGCIPKSVPEVGGTGKFDGGCLWDDGGERSPGSLAFQVGLHR